MSIGKSSLARAAGMADLTPAPVVASVAEPPVCQEARLETVAIASVGLMKGQPVAEADIALVRSIEKNGVLEPILLAQTKTGYVLVAGARRLAAAQKAGLTSIPAVVKQATESTAKQWNRELQKFTTETAVGGQGTAVGDDMPTWLL